MTLWCVLALSVGVVFGFLLHYLIGYRPLLERYHELTDKMYRMKRQGFVPQYDIEQDHAPDLARDVVEY